MPSMTLIEQNLGSTPAYSGSFDIVTSGQTTGGPIHIEQIAAVYTGKGSGYDESGMDIVQIVAYAVSDVLIRTYWLSQYPVSGNFKFAYVAIRLA
jgi:hypothetical protein